ncbi:YbfB/YjiJ family MFS transporter [Labrys wisconsinensis]|uniref:MFS family arabinose efflux permease n=1 Tax=Labrys wisconsinensis TaxID=425677 RepID=A0ABU0JEA1_9HYPH|nr:YbfB/YjiJ family MFS transporter [Labrys wisconsinensis]MDQ0472600.1 putative MFS family arabinose efflux permease [Labrys wisconsinensis]
MSSPQPRPLALATGGLLALAVAMGIGRFVYTPILPAMAQALGLGKGQAGIIAGANFAGYLAGALIASTSALPGPRRAWLLGGLCASAATTAAMALASSVAAMSVLRFAGGLASAFVLVFASALVLERLAQAGRAGLSAVLFAGVGVGILASSGVVSSLAAWAWDWRSQWLACGLVSALVIPAVAVLVPPAGEARAAGSDAPAGPADRRLRLLIPAYGLFGAGYVVTATFLVAIVRDSAAARPLEPYVWAVVGLAVLPSIWVWNRIAARLGLYAAFALACLVEAAGVALSVTGWALGPVVGAVLLGGTFMSITALGLIAARSLAAANPRRAVALMTVAFSIGQIVGPIFAGIAFDLTGSFVVPSLAAAAALILAAGLVARLGRPLAA